MLVEMTASGVLDSQVNKQQLEIDMVDVPVSGTEVMFVCVGMVDAGRPNLVSAEFIIPSAPDQTMELVSSSVGAGGNSFPAGFIVALKDPAATSGTVRVVFDEYVAVMNGIGLVFSGLDSAGGVFIPHAALPLNPQLPDFRVEDYLTVPSGQFVLDMCMAESSNHTAHVLTSGSLSTKIADTSVSMHKFSTVWQVTSSGGPALIEREDCGGPFAGVSLTAVSIGTI
jgi:hypothetical protein